MSAWVDVITFGMDMDSTISFDKEDDNQLDAFYLAFHCLRQAIKYTASNANDIIYPTANFKKKYRYDHPGDSKREV